MGRVVSSDPTSPTFIRVVTVEAGRTHAVLPTLEYSTPVSSPAAPGLTSPQVLRSLVLQASSASEDGHRVLSDASGFRCSGLESFEHFE